MAMLICKTASCDVLQTWAKQKGCWLAWTASPQPGDLVIFDFAGNHTRCQHVGILIARTGSTLTCIEGNTSVTSNDNGGAVMRRTRYTSQVTGYVRPRWTAEQTAEKLMLIAQAQVGVKEIPSGSNKVKYNTWYWGRAVSGSAYPWCAAFVSWCFAVLAGEISGETIPTTTTEVTTMVTIRLPLLKRGVRGSAVGKMQRELNALGYDCGTVDNDFGPKTEKAVLAFQRDNGLVQDAEAGAATLTKLYG